MGEVGPAWISATAVVSESRRQSLGVLGWLTAQRDMGRFFEEILEVIADKYM